METATAPAPTGMTRVKFRDWGGTRTAALQMPSNVSVAEAVEEARTELDLPADVSYLALHRERQLDDLSTLQDAGIGGGATDAEAEIDLVANVKAG